MRVLVFGVFDRSGVAQKTGNHYQISRVVYGTEIKPVARDNMKYKGFGYEMRELDLDSSCLSQFADYSDEMPCYLDLKIDPKPDNPTRNWVVGVNGMAE